MTWLGSSKIAMLVSLLVLPYAHEDLAIVLGAAAVVKHALDVATGAATETSAEAGAAAQ